MLCCDILVVGSIVVDAPHAQRVYIHDVVGLGPPLVAILTFSYPCLPPTRQLPEAAEVAAAGSGGDDTAIVLPRPRRARSQGTGHAADMLHCSRAADDALGWPGQKRAGVAQDGSRIVASRGGGVRRGPC